jgi:hypothetical protein
MQNFDPPMSARGQGLKGSQRAYRVCSTPDSRRQRGRAEAVGQCQEATSSHLPSCEPAGSTLAIGVAGVMMLSLRPDGNSWQSA